MKLDLVSPDFLFTFGFTLGKHTGNICISEIAISNLLRKSNILIKSFLILLTTNAVLELVTIYHSICSGAFSPTLRHCYCKANECRNRVNIRYS